MNKIVIFGDSFADPLWPVEGADKKCDQLAWCHLLKQHNTVENLALSGTGPDWSLSRLTDYILHNNTSDTNLIFISSSIERLDLDCYKDPSEQVHLSRIATGELRHKSQQFARNAVNWYMTDRWQQNRQIMYYSAIATLAHHFKRTLYWPALTPLADTLKLCNSSSITMPSVGLMQLSKLDDPSYTGVGLDTRVNHFNPHNHQYIHQQLHNWCNHNTPISVEGITKV